MKQRTSPRRSAIALGMALAVSLSVSAQEAVNETVVAQIKGDAMLPRKPLPKPHADAK